MAAGCATGGLLFGTGDIIAQQIIEKKGKDHDVSSILHVLGSDTERVDSS